MGKLISKILVCIVCSALEVILTFLKDIKLSEEY